MRNAALLALLMAGIALGQNLSFELASIKPSPPLDPQDRHGGQDARRDAD
jgi:hypothetical protein